MKPKRLFPGTPKVRRDQADRMLVKLKKRGHSRAQAMAALVLHIWGVFGWRRGQSPLHKWFRRAYHAA